MFNESLLNSISTKNLLAALAIFLSKNIQRPLKSRKIYYNVKVVVRKTYSPLATDIRTPPQVGKMSAATAKQTNKQTTTFSIIDFEAAKYVMLKT